MLNQDASGWSYPSPGTGLVSLYVDPDAGDDSWGGSRAAPFKTVRRATDFSKPGQLTHVYVRAGSVARERLWLKGRSNVVLTTYTADADNAGPRAVFPVDKVYGASQIQDCAQIAILNFEFDGTGNPDAAERPTAIRAYTVRDFWVEGCLVRKADKAIECIGGLGKASYNFTARRNVLVDSIGNRSQGIYTSWTKGQTILENVVDGCGWRNLSPAFALENHALYLDDDGAKELGGLDVEVGHNFIGTPCSHGVQARAGAHNHHNVYWRCPIAAFGQGDVSHFLYNFIQESAEIGMGVLGPGFPERYRSWGYHHAARNGSVVGNWAIDGGLPTYTNIDQPGYAFRLGHEARVTGTPPSAVSFFKNRSIGWHGGQFVRERNKAGVVAKRDGEEFADNVWGAFPREAYDDARVVTAGHVDGLRAYSRAGGLSPVVLYDYLRGGWRPNPLVTIRPVVRELAGAMAGLAEAADKLQEAQRGAAEIMERVKREMGI